MDASGRFHKVRTFAFLQGPPSGFWSKLATTLAADGHRVIKIHFSLGDRVFWNAGNSFTYRDPFTSWETWFDALIRNEGITDVLYFNDRFPYHEAARRVAKKRGIRPWCVEFGYLRPDWISLEPEGLNWRSRFPRERSSIAQLAAFGSTTDQTVRFPHRFVTEASHEVCFNLLQSMGRLYSPGFHADRPLHPALEYLGWLPKTWRKCVHAPREKSMMRGLAKSDQDHYLVALQMAGDYEVRSSPFGDIEPFLDRVFSSFVAHAPKDARLLVKAHPLESGWVDWRKKTRRISEAHGLVSRVTYTDGDTLDDLLSHVKGMVVINSTAGLKALQNGVPVAALGGPIYDRAGLTHQGDLDDFWCNPQAVDAEFLQTFLKALSLVQVKGSFYNRAGQTHAIREIARRLTGKDVFPINTMLAAS